MRMRTENEIKEMIVVIDKLINVDDPQPDFPKIKHINEEPLGWFSVFL